jgi:hypothetical protein
MSLIATTRSGLKGGNQELLDEDVEEVPRQWGSEGEMSEAEVPYVIQDLEAELSRRGIQGVPTANSLASLFACTLHEDPEDQDPLTFLPGSVQEKVYNKPIEHDWWHLGTRDVSLNGQSVTANLFAVNLNPLTGPTEYGPDDGIHGSVSLRVLFTELNTSQSLTQERPTSPGKAVMSIDNLLYEIVALKDAQNYPEENWEDTAAGRAFTAKVPESMISAMRYKIAEGGRANILESEAQAIVQDMNQILYQHFDGDGTVDIPDPWPVPDIPKFIEASGNASINTNVGPIVAERTQEDLYWDDVASKTLKSFAKSKKPMSNAEKAEWDSLEAGFAALPSQAAEERIKKKHGESKRKKQKKIEGASHASDTGPSGWSQGS